MQFTLTIRKNFDFSGMADKVRAAMIMAAEQSGIHLVKAIKTRFDVGGPGWAEKWDGTPSHLTETGRLKSSIRYIRKGYNVTVLPGAGGGHGYFKGKSRSETLELNKRGSVRYRRAYKVSKGFYKTTTKIGVYHELGTSKMPARPFMEPTAKAEGKNVAQIYKDALKRIFG